MIKLTNIMQEGDILSADFEAETSGQIGHIEIDVPHLKVVGEKLPALQNIDIYRDHAEAALLGIAKKGVTSDRMTVFWY